jgi:ribosomal protein S18 acetylase RimI-like enzyme
MGDEIMINVRKYQPKDKERLRMICIETSKLPHEEQIDKDFLVVAFNDYYTENEPDNIFVAVNEDDEAVGYILCSENFYDFYDIMKKFYLPEIKELGFNYYTMMLGEILAHKLYSKRYPAHLHIDILEEYQNQGYGSKLMNALFDELKSRGVPGVMLGTSAHNKGAIRFYERLGFKILVKTKNGPVMMGKELK